MKIIEVQQNTEEWLELRRGRVTGSKLKGLIVKRGTKRKLGFYELMAERISIPEETGEAPMDRGHRLEDEALELFEKKYNRPTTKVGFCISDSNSSIALSPDALIKSKGKYREAVEIKCLSSARHLQAFFEQEVPSDYEAQVMQYFIVNDDLEKLHLVFYDPRITRLPMFRIVVEREDVEDTIQAYREYQVAALAEIDKMLEQLMF